MRGSRKLIIYGRGGGGGAVGAGGGWNTNGKPSGLNIELFGPYTKKKLSVTTHL